MITDEDRKEAKETKPYKAFYLGLKYGFRCGYYTQIIFKDATSVYAQFIGQIKANRKRNKE